MAIINNIYNYFDRNQELKVLFVFDPMMAYSAELQNVVWREGFRLEEFKGNWFATKYAIENEWKDQKVVLLLPMSAPFKQEEKAKFPLMDVLVANAEFKSNDHEAFMQQNSIHDIHSDFIHRHVSELQLEKFNRILKDYYSDAFSTDVGYRGLISGYMGESKLQTWNDIILRLMVLGYRYDEAKSQRIFVAIQQQQDVLLYLKGKIQAIFGVTYDENTEQKMVKVAQQWKYNLITQLLGVENADNYKHLKVTNSVQLEQMNQLHQFVATLPPKRREEWQQAFDALSADIKEGEIIKVYSLNAEFFYVPIVMCWEILNTIITHQLKTTSEEALDRLRVLKMKHLDNVLIMSVIDYAMEVASFYLKRDALGSLILNTPDDYISKYTTEYYLLDTYYRKSLEYFLNLDADLPVLNAIEQVKAALDKDYASIVNDINIEWARCLKERGNGYGEITQAFRQEHFYQTKRQTTKWVVIVSDALRYEVAKELTEELNRSKHNATLDAALAMLPTETKYCKPALFPHRDMDFYGDATLGIDKTSLDTTEKRTQHLRRYVEDAVCIDFETVQACGKEEARRIFANTLVYVFHNAIDNARHSGTRGNIVSACRDSIKEIANVVRKIHNTCSVSNIIVTADHGFLYNDMAFAENDKTGITEETIEQKSRYYLTKSADEVTNVLKFPIENVSGINADLFVAVPIGTNRFKTQGADYNFVHGGATLQEIVIPVVHSALKRTDVKRKVDITMITRTFSIVSSRLKVQLLQSEAISAEVKEREICCAIYCNDKKVSNDVVLTLNSTDAEVLQNRMYEINLTLNQAVSSGLLQFRIYDKEDMLNPLVKETVTNNTLIEQDF